MPSSHCTVVVLAVLFALARMRLQLPYAPNNLSIATPSTPSHYQDTHTHTHTPSSTISYFCVYLFSYSTPCCRLWWMPAKRRGTASSLRIPKRTQAPIPARAFENSSRLPINAVHVSMPALFYQVSPAPPIHCLLIPFTQKKKKGKKRVWATEATRFALLSLPR